MMNAARLRRLDVRIRIPVLAAAIASIFCVCGRDARADLIFTLTSQVTLEPDASYLYEYDLRVSPASTLGVSTLALGVPTRADPMNLTGPAGWDTSFSA